MLRLDVPEYMGCQSIQARLHFWIQSGRDCEGFTNLVESLLLLSIHVESVSSKDVNRIY